MFNVRRLVLTILATLAFLGLAQLTPFTRAQVTSPELYLPAISDSRSTATVTPTPSQTATVTLTSTATSTATTTPASTATTFATARPVTETPVSTPTDTPGLPPPDFVNCATVGNPSRAPNFPVAIIDIDKEEETVTLRNLSSTAVDLTGWRMCSVTGGQEHPIGGALAPGQTQTFDGPTGFIWNNSSSDPGALWNPAGQLVSYLPD